jgi:O-methyltransferase
LLKRVLTDTVCTPEPRRGTPGFAAAFIDHYFSNPRPFTCVPVERLDHLEACLRRVVAEEIPGDVVEAGVWRGGVTMLMRAVLRELQANDRTVWVADSFAGLPRPDADRFPKEAFAYDTPVMQQIRQLAVPLGEVAAGFRTLGLLDDCVRFLPGWFADTLPAAPIDRLALLRIDADFYQSTWDALHALYDRLSPGGFVIIDDYGEASWTDCQAAVDQFREARGIAEPLEPVDPYCWFWRKEPTHDIR